MHTYIHTHTHTYIHTYIQTDRQTDRHTDRQTDRQSRPNHTHNQGDSRKPPAPNASVWGPPRPIASAEETEFASVSIDFAVPRGPKFRRISLTFGFFRLLASDWRGLRRINVNHEGILRFRGPSGPLNLLLLAYFWLRSAFWFRGLEIRKILQQDRNPRGCPSISRPLGTLIFFTFIVLLASFGFLVRRPSEDLIFWRVFVPLLGNLAKYVLFAHPDRSLHRKTRGFIRFPNDETS